VEKCKVLNSIPRFNALITSLLVPPAAAAYYQARQIMGLLKEIKLLKKASKGMKSSWSS
jgi:hypothetical protein